MALAVTALHVEAGGVIPALLLMLGGVGLSAAGLRRSLRLRRERAGYRPAADVQGERRTPDERHTTADPRVRVLAHDTPAAFCIPGSRGHSPIVVTTAALETLLDNELAAAAEALSLGPSPRAASAAESGQVQVQVQVLRAVTQVGSLQAHPARGRVTRPRHPPGGYAPRHPGLREAARRGVYFDILLC